MFITVNSTHYQVASCNNQKPSQSQIQVISLYPLKILATINTDRLIGLVRRVFANGPGDLGSIASHVIPKTLKMVLDTSLLNTQQYKVHIKGKVEQSRERSSALPDISVWYLLKREPSGRPPLRLPTLLFFYLLIQPSTSSEFADVTNQNLKGYSDSTWYFMIIVNMSPVQPPSNLKNVSPSIPQIDCRTYNKTTINWKYSTFSSTLMNWA